MLALHALWDTQTGAFHLWAESSDLALVAAKRARASTRKEFSRPHPFTLPASVLQETLANFAGSLALNDTQIGMHELRLPSTAVIPWPSPELLVEEIREDAQPGEIAPWEVPTLRLDSSHAFDFLLRLPSHPPRGLAFSSSLRYWSLAAQFAFELITRQSFVPTLYEEGRKARTVTCRAAWDIVLSPDDTERLRQLANAMPPVCWSFLPPGDKPASVLQNILHHFLNRLTDIFVRESLAPTPLITTKRSTRTNRPIQEQWLQALSSLDSHFTASDEKATEFAMQLRNWLDEVRPTATDTAFRTCFKLEAPDSEVQEQKTETWQISYHLQASDDPSLLIPAERVWQEQSSTLTFLKRKFENPQERLLADLGKAARLFPHIEKSLRATHPRSLHMETEQAYTFLREIAPLLEDSGFGVLIPPWWGKTAARLGVKLKIRPQQSSTKQEQSDSGLFGLQSIVNYSWDIALGDTTITPEEFAHLVSLKQPLVHIRGQWVELRPQEVEAAIAFFEKRRAQKDITLGEALRTGLGQETLTDDLPVTSIEAEGWIKEAMDKLYDNTHLQTIKIPGTLNGTLRPYQTTGVSWLAFLKQYGFGSCLADDMGLGKSVELITLLLHERDQRSIQTETKLYPTLLVCPMSIVGNWERELQRFAPLLSVLVHHGGGRLAGEDFIAEAWQHDVVITTYPLVLRDQKMLNEIEWENIVIDEAQNIKNESAKQTRAVKSLKGRHRIALTGTPVENRLSELWSIMEFLNPGYLGSATEFRSSFALPIERYHNKERAETLKRMVQPFILRRLKTDKDVIQDLPDKLEMKVYCNLTREQASLYEAVVQEMLLQVEEAEGISRRGLILSALMRLKQICNHPAQFMSDGSSLPQRSGKLMRLEEMLEEALAEGDKALIFTQFAEMGTLLQQYLQEVFGVEVLFLHGGTQKKQRDAMVLRFQEERQNTPIFLLSLKAGGVGLNLTAANHVFHFDRWWNPAVENQATDRAFRIGQKRNVQVHKFVCAGTLEERIDQMIEQKKDLAERIIGAGENWLTEMSTAQLRELFTLNRNAIGE